MNIGNDNDNDNDNDDDKVHCPDCEALIPKNNLELHRVRACTMATLNVNGGDGSSPVTSPNQRPRKARRRGNSDEVAMMDEDDDDYGDTTTSTDNNNESNNEIIDLINETTPSNSVVGRVNDTLTASNNNSYDDNYEDNRKLPAREAVTTATATCTCIHCTYDQENGDSFCELCGSIRSGIAIVPNEVSLSTSVPNGALLLQMLLS